MPGHGDAVAGPAQCGGQVPRRDGGAAGAVAMATGRRAARAAPRHGGARGGGAAAGARHAPIAL